ncbi:MAG: hypothetical protein AB1486_34850 [Planctomycetota bacterium]
MPDPSPQPRLTPDPQSTPDINPERRPNAQPKPEPSPRLETVDGAAPSPAMPGGAKLADGPTPESVPGTIPTPQPSGHQPGHGTVRLVGGQAYEAKDRQMTKAARGGDVCRRVLAFNLAEMEKRKIYYFGGYTSTVQYAVLRLLISRREARELIVTGRALLELDEIDAALRSGRISWTKARLLTRIATKETETAWLERALASNCADLEAALDSQGVAMAKKGKRPRDNLKGLPEPRVRLDCWLRAVTYEKWELMRAKLSETLRREQSDDDLIGFLTELGLSTDRAPLPGSPPDGAVAPSLTPTEASIYRVVIHECPTCHEARLGDGTAVGAEELALAKCDGGVECLSDDEDGDGADVVRPLPRAPSPRLSRDRGGGRERRAVPESQAGGAGSSRAPRSACARDRDCW